MNDAELDLLARRAAGTVRAEADRIADSRSALAEVLQRRTGPAADAERARRVDGAADRARRRSPWVPILAAATAIAALAGIVLTLRGDEPGQIVVTTGPGGPDDTDDDAVVGTVPGTIPGSSAPDTTAAIPIDEVVVVPDEIGPELARTVLATYGTGDGPGDLGFEDCQECQPIVPWAPVVTGDRTVYVADVWNGRWQLFRDGAWTSLPFRAGEVVVAGPVVGPDGLIYAAVADALAPVSPRRVLAYEANLTATEAYDVATGGMLFGSVDLVGGDALRYGFSEVRRFDLPLGSATWGVDPETRQVSLALSGIFREFRLPATWEVAGSDATALDDGSIVLHAWAPREQEGRSDWFLVRLWPDGTWATGTIGTNPITTDLDGRFSRTGFVQLEPGQVVEYAVPTLAPTEPVTPVDLGTTLISGLDPAPVEPEELYRAGIGDAVDELGLEDCQECEPTVPWSPVVLPDGRIVIVDNLNRRWITVTGGVPAATPLPDRVSVVGQPVVDADGRIVVVAQTASAATPGVVSFFDPDDLTAPVDEVPVEEAVVFSRLELDGGSVVVNGRIAATLATSVGELPEVEYHFGRSPATVAVTWNGGRRLWQYPVALDPSGGVRLPDGSITNSVFDDGELLVVRLLPNGDVRSIAVPASFATNGATATTLDGHVQLERDGEEWVVRRYPLP